MAALLQHQPLLLEDYSAAAAAPVRLAEPVSLLPPTSLEAAALAPQRPRLGLREVPCLAERAD